MLALYSTAKTIEHPKENIGENLNQTSKIRLLVKTWILESEYLDSNSNFANN